MKKLLLIIALLISGVGLNAQNVGDNTIIDYEGYSLQFTITSVEPAKCEVKCSTKPTEPTAITIPYSAEISGIECSVTSIGDGAFSECSSLTSIEIPNSVTSIGYEAFEYCSSLTSITFGENSQLTSIGWGAFSDCSSLTSIEIPNSVTSIGNWAFQACSSLTSIVVAEGNTVYDSRDNCNAIIKTSSNTLIVGCQNTVIPNSVTSIGDYAFSGCSSLSSIEITNSVTSIGGEAFSECSSLTSIEIPNSVTSIGGEAFEYCSSLTSITFGENSQLTSIGYNAFYECSSLTSIEIPNSVTSIENFPFCSSLTSIVVAEGNTVYDSRENCNAIIETSSNTLIAGCQNTVIPNSVTSIGEYAFVGSSLTSIEIPNSVTFIDEHVFNFCSDLESIVVEAGNTVYDSRNNCNAIIETSTNKLLYGCVNTVIPSDVTSIEDQAFIGKNNITTIIIPDNVISIGGLAFYECLNLESIVFEENSKLERFEDGSVWGCFYNCKELKSITIPKSVKYIGRETFKASGLENIVFEEGSKLDTIGYLAFSGCSSLTSIEIPNSVTSIEQSAFSGCSSLTSIEIPNPVTSVGNYAFKGCSSLTSIICHAENVPETESSAFDNCPSDMIIYVPASSVEAYKATSPWNNYNIIPLENEQNHWIPDETLYPNSMTVIAEVQINGVSQKNLDLEIGALCGDEVRGSTKTLYIEEQDKYLHFLVIYGNDNDNINFKIYDHTMDSVLDLKAQETMTFKVNEVGGTIDSPKTINFTSRVQISTSVNYADAGTTDGDGYYHIGDSVTLVATPNKDYIFRNWTLNDEVVSEDSEFIFAVTGETNYVANFYSAHERQLKSGWSWYSTNIALEGAEGLKTVQDALTDNANIIKSQTAFNTYEQDKWNGTLDEFSTENMYMINLKNQYNLVIEGAIANPMNHPIDIKNNWNWIGMTVGKKISVSDALANFTPNHNDIFKSQTAFSQYYEGTGWYGTLQLLEPGQGYMYQNLSGETKTLVYSDVVRSRDAVSNISSENNRWVADYTKYQTNMNVVAIVKNEDIVLDNYEIGAFCEDECRGSARPIYVEPTDNYMIFLTIYGDDSEEIYLRLYDIYADKEMTLDSNIGFEANATLGTIDEPYVISFATLNINEISQDKVNVYPNPVSDMIFVETSGDIEEIVIFNMNGQQMTVDSNISRGIDVSELNSGVYFIRITTRDETVTKQFVKQ